MKTIPTELTREALQQFIFSEIAACAQSQASIEREAGVSKDSLRDFGRGKALYLRVDKLQKVLRHLGYDLIIKPQKGGG